MRTIFLIASATLVGLVSCGGSSKMTTQQKARKKAARYNREHVEPLETIQQIGYSCKSGSGAVAPACSWHPDSDFRPCVWKAVCDSPSACAVMCDCASKKEAEDAKRKYCPTQVDCESDDDCPSTYHCDSSGGGLCVK